MMFKTPSRAAGTLTIGLVLLVATTIFAQKLSGPESKDEETAKMAVGLLSRQHMSRQQVDDKVSEHLFERYLEELDPRKLYFTRDDIDSFAEYRHRLDDQLKEGNIDFAYKVFNLYLKRVKQRLALAQKLIDQKFDFEADDEKIRDPEERIWAPNERVIQERWAKRIKYDLLRLIIEEKSLEEARSQVHKRYENIERSRKQLGSSEILEMYLSSFAHCFDPHSSYMSPQTLEDFQIAMKLSLEGIGAALRSENGYTTVVKIVPGGAADKDGRLQVGDQIVAVAQGEDGEFIPIIEMKLSKVVRYIRGEKGTKVRLKVKKAETGKTDVYTLTRQKIQLESKAVNNRIIDTKERLGEDAGRIGIIDIPSFYRDFRGAREGKKDFRSTSRDVIEALQTFQKQGGVDAIVIDLRTNGGGALREAIEVSGLFIKDGPIVQVKKPDGEVKIHSDPDSRQHYAGPLVVLCNRMSASASEIFAGAIKDYRRGIVVGDTTTHGKGTVQNVMPVGKPLVPFLEPEKRGALKLTISKFYRVNGASTQKRGVRSNIVLPSLLDHMEIGEQYLDNALKFDRIPPAEYTTLGMVTSKIIETLEQRSQQRIQESDKFQEIQADIREYEARQEKDTISLKKSELRKELANEEEAAPEDLGTGDEQHEEEDDEEKIFEKSAYGDEVLHITADYIRLLGRTTTAKN